MENLFIQLWLLLLCYMKIICIKYCYFVSDLAITCQQCLTYYNWGCEWSFNYPEVSIIVIIIPAPVIQERRYRLKDISYQEFCIWMAEIKTRVRGKCVFQKWKDIFNHAMQYTHNKAIFISNNRNVYAYPISSKYTRTNIHGIT